MILTLTRKSWRVNVRVIEDGGQPQMIFKKSRCGNVCGRNGRYGCYGGKLDGDG